MKSFQGTARLKGDGYTLVELMITVAIVGILSAIMSHYVVKLEEQTKEQQAVADIREIENKIAMFVLSSGRLPVTLAEAGADKLDPWGNPYYYLNVTAGKKGPPKGARKDKSLHPVNTDYDLYSAGADGKTNAPLTAKSSRDDIIRGGNGGYYGPAEGF